MARTRGDRTGREEKKKKKPKKAKLAPPPSPGFGLTTRREPGSPGSPEPPSV